MPPRDTRRVTVVFGSETQDAERGFRRVNDQAETLGDKIKNLSGRFDDLKGDLVQGIAGAAVVAGFQKAIQSAIDLNETITKTRTVFKTGSKDLEAWADTAATSLGMSKNAALQGASAFGNMFKQVGLTEGVARKMSKRMVELAADFASFHNAEPAEVMEALQSATRGEYDALQKFVPTVNAARVETQGLADTGKKAASALTDAEKATALYNVVLKGAGDAAGDFGRNAGGAANQQRILMARLEDTAAAVGNAVLPAYELIIGLINKLGPLQTVAIGIAVIFGRQIATGFLAARAGLATWTASVINTIPPTTAATGAVGRLGTAFATTGAFAQAAGSKMLAAGRSMSTLAKGGAIFAGVMLISEAFRNDINPQIDALTAKLKEFGRTGQLTGEASRLMGENFSNLAGDLEVIGTGVLGKAGNAIGEFAEWITFTDDILDNSIKHKKERVKAWDDALKSLVESGEVAAASKTFAKIEEEAKKQGKTLTDLKAAFPGYYGALDVAAVSNAEAARAADKFTNEVKATLPVIKGSATGLGDFQKAIELTGTTVLDSNAHLLQLTMISEKLGDAHLKSSDKSKLFSDALTQIDTSSEPFMQRADAMAAVLDDISTSSMESADKGKLFAQALESIEGASAQTETRADALINLFNNVANAEMNAKTKGDLLKSTIDSLYGALMSQSEAEEAVVSSQVKLSESFQKNGYRLDLTTAKTNAQKTATLANRDALEAALQATQDKYIADIAAGESSDKAREAYNKTRTSILNSIKPTKDNKNAVEDLNKRYGEIPPAKNTSITVSGDQVALDALVKSFALQKGLNESWPLDKTESYYNQLYQQYVLRNFIGPVPRRKLAAGGPVGGWSPHDKADNIPAWLTADEFVQPVDAVKHYGVDFMEAIRQKKLQVVPDGVTGMAARFAGGGSVHGGPNWPMRVPINVKLPQPVADLKKKYTDFLEGGGLGGEHGGAGWKWQIAHLKNLFGNFGVYSTFRRSKTISGNWSWHSKGRAVDVEPQRRIADYIWQKFGKTTHELITPWRDRMIYRGRPHKYSQAIENQHGVGRAGNDHIHWAYDNGGVLPPGQSTVVNATGDNEYVLTPDQLSAVATPQVSVTVNVAGNVTTERDLAASIATAVRDELLRHAKRNGGRTGL